MKKFKKYTLGPVQVVILAVLLSGIGSYVYASSFAEPSCSPPGCNADAPINVSGSAQIKSGGLTVAAGAGITTGLVVVTGNVGIGTSNPAHKLDVNGDVGATAFYYTSDRNLKDNIAPLSDSLDKIMQLQGVSFTWKPGVGGPSGTQIGLVAQDVQKVYPEAVAPDGKSVEYANLVAPLIEAVKTQQQEIQALQGEVKALQSK